MGHIGIFVLPLLWSIKWQRQWNMKWKLLRYLGFRVKFGRQVPSIHPSQPLLLARREFGRELYATQCQAIETMIAKGLTPRYPVIEASSRPRKPVRVFQNSCHVVLNKDPHHPRLGSPGPGAAHVRAMLRKSRVKSLGFGSTFSARRTMRNMRGLDGANSTSGRPSTC